MDALKLPVLSLEDFEAPPEPNDPIENIVDGSGQYAFIVSGQGGGRLAAEAYRIGYHKTICLNTSPQDLSYVEVPETHKLHLDIGPGGAGKNPGLGEQAVVQHGQLIYDRMRAVLGNALHEVRRTVPAVLLCAVARVVLARGLW